MVKSLRERVRELEAELDSDRSCRERVQADALALQAELDGLRLQQAEQAQQGLTEAESMTHKFMATQKAELTCILWGHSHVC